MESKKCPGCKQPLSEEKALNALSRYHNTEICSDCGRKEAFEGDFISKVMANSIITFLKEAFIVDGEVQFASEEENEAINQKNHRWIKLEDSKRGTFYLGVHTSKNN